MLNSTTHLPLPGSRVRYYNGGWTMGLLSEHNEKRVVTQHPLFRHYYGGVGRRASAQPSFAHAAIDQRPATI
ncbi:hypothetical protein ALC53_04922 [Atta colombica]|uniref:Uncharacterized protein n=1 Tax=Atta colombica TaxID=520822 RepID=A0A195BJ47_9HYME|nr:hypothetical protein ALC53_04922 [Atta colombica]